jgi:peptidoglycan/LPS O-acetylase OafA/YrhL
MLRFIAASAVVVYHFTYRPMIHGKVDEHAFGWLQSLTRYGYLGVSLFFMISGFVILWSSQARSPGEFVVSRISRLYPSFWVSVTLTTLVVTFWGVDHIGARTFLANLTMVPQAAHADYIDGVYWTLFVELKFYFLVFVVLLTGTMKHVERWLAVWLLACVFAAVGLAPKWIASIAMYPYGPYFISGCLLFLVRSQGRTAFRLGGFLVSAILATRYAVQQQPDFMQNITLTTSVAVVCIVAALHVLFATVALRPNILPSSRWWYWIGSLTYPLYLLHNRIGKTLWSNLPVSMSPWLAVAIMMIVVYALSAVVATFIEQRVCGNVHRRLMRVATSLRLAPVSRKANAQTS